MTDLSIYLYSERVYKQKNQPVVEFNEALSNTTAEIFKLLKTVTGKAIAAPQVGINKRFIIADIPSVAVKQCFYNPEILEQDDVKLIDMECLSMPGVKMTVPRPNTLKLQYQDATGERKILDAEGELAHQIYHLIDILNNKQLVDNLSSLKKDRFIKKYEKWLAHEFSNHHHDEEGHVHGPDCQHDH